jgi:hypothetical protein
MLRCFLREIGCVVSEMHPAFCKYEDNCMINCLPGRVSWRTILRLQLPPSLRYSGQAGWRWGCIFLSQYSLSNSHFLLLLPSLTFSFSLWVFALPSSLRDVVPSAANEVYPLNQEVRCSGFISVPYPRATPGATDMLPLQGNTTQYSHSNSNCLRSP